MKKLVFLLSSVLLLGIASCDGNGKTDANESGQDTDSLTEEDLKVVDTEAIATGLRGDSVFVGIIGDGTSQHVLVLYSKNEDGEADTTQFIMDGDVDKTNCHGLVEGARCEVVFHGDLQDKPKVTYIETEQTYSTAIGRWSCDNPDDKANKFIIEFQSKGKAVSNMTKFKAVSWQVYDDRARTIFITVEKDGATDDITAQISEDGRTLTIEGDAKVYVKEQK